MYDTSPPQRIRCGELTAAHPSVLAPGATLGPVPLDATRGFAALERERVRVVSRVPTVALSSAQVACHHTTLYTTPAIIILLRQPPWVHPSKGGTGNSDLPGNIRAPRLGPKSTGKPLSRHGVV